LDFILIQHLLIFPFDKKFRKQNHWVHLFGFNRPQIFCKGIISDTITHIRILSSVISDSITHLCTLSCTKTGTITHLRTLSGVISDTITHLCTLSCTKTGTKTHFRSLSGVISVKITYLILQIGRKRE